MDKDNIVATAHAVADAARQAVLPFFRSEGLSADNKAGEGFDPVTEGDRATERAMRDVLAKLRPADGILGEEYETQHGTSGLTWVLDPDRRYPRVHVGHAYLGCSNRGFR